LRILGIDPGLSSTGYGVVEVEEDGLSCLTFGGFRAAHSASFSDKLLAIHQKIEKVIQQFHPDFCAIENIYYHQNKKTAIIMGHARAVAMLAVAQNRIEVSEYSPREIKMSIVGFGAASKIQVQAMVKNLLKLDSPPQPDDAADALAVALCHFHRLKSKQIMQGV
jgi:crossover junction endodeoxyribonuclease RuvC